MSTPTALPFSRIGARIRLARAKTGLSQEAFATQIGTSRRHVMRLERGQHRPSEPMAARIAEVTGITVQELLADDEDEEASMSFGAAMEAMLKRAVDRAVRDFLSKQVTL